ncbi:MAG TPA: MarR family transcriptional regulator [Devosiaceae bacterium]|jgi:DNA-binding MarR family transcriptional regulator
MTQQLSVSDLQTHLGYWLRAVSNAVSQSFARKVEAEGVTVAEWVFLRVLYEGEDIAPSLLAERMGMTKGAISKLADRLLEKGHIKRHANAQDGRAHTLSLTPAARTLVPRLAAIADRNDAEFFGGLMATEQAQLRTLLQKIALQHELMTTPID